MHDIEKYIEILTKNVEVKNWNSEDFINAYEQFLTSKSESDKSIDDHLLSLIKEDNSLSSLKNFFKDFFSHHKNDFVLFSQNNYEEVDFLYNQDGFSTTTSLEPYNVDLNNNGVIHTHGWLYSFAENLFAYTYDITYHIFQNYIYVEAPHIQFKKYWINSLRVDQYGYLNAFVMDQLYALTIIMIPIFNEFFKNFASSIEFSTFLENHPECYLIFKDYALNYYFYYFSNYYVSLYSLNITESFLSPVMIIFQFFFILFSVLALFMVYFNYYGNPSSEENIVDHDYLVFNVTIEAEEEIGSLDDMLLASVILLYIFLWFFWIHSWSSMGTTPKLVMSIYLFPFIYYIIIFIPFSLLYDYGLYFLTYLNGVGKSSVLLVELMFDYIAVSIFYLRLIVQNVRLAFMLFTFLELHELVIFFNIDKNLFPLNDYFIDSWDNVKTYTNFPTYYLAFSVPTMIIKWLYELFHTFFMVIFQFVAFFAMIFWLFLFLYSMFVSETQENYLTFKRMFRKDFFKNKINLKIVKI